MDPWGGFPGATRVFFVSSYQGLPGPGHLLDFPPFSAHLTWPSLSRRTFSGLRATHRMIGWDEIAATWKFGRKFYPKFHPGGSLDSCWMNHFLDHFVHQKFWIQKSGGSSKESTSELHRFKSRWQIPLSCRYSKPKDTCGASQRIYPCP